MGQQALFTNQTSDGDSAVIEIRDGGYRIIKVTGVMGSATLTLNCDFTDDDYAPLIEDNIPQTITVPGVLNIQPFKSGMRFKLTLSGATGTTDVTAKLL